MVLRLREYAAMEANAFLFERIVVVVDFDCHFFRLQGPMDADRHLIVFRDFSSRVVWSVGRLLHLVCDFGFRVVDYILPFARFLVILDAGYLVIDYWFECDS